MNAPLERVTLPTGAARVAGVIGWPVSHSKSPALHTYWLRHYGLDGAYVPLPVAPGDLDAALLGLKAAGFRGVNVTIPHKEEALRLADTVSDAARRIGAANTLTFQPDGCIQADNTDSYGFIANLQQSAPTWSAASGPAVVLGAGGAARAVLDGLLRAGAPKIYLANRTRDRAEAVQSAFGDRVSVVPFKGVSALLADVALLVNTTSLGMTGKPHLDLSLDGLTHHALVTDIVYTPLKTPLLEDAAATGVQTVDGLGMLLHQAAPGFERWFGVKPTVTDALRNAVLALDAG
ncbi:MAG: shikimate dehydrogenase [Alphaproteobacteria bacterium]|nr:shikimate dehydrogenase [Alphaproteobacteria bacterium]